MDDLEWARPLDGPRPLPVTLLLTDLADLASAQWRPQNGLAELLVEYLRDVVRIASSRQGAVESLLGARVSVIFGVLTPSQAGETPAMALEAALEIRARAAELARAFRTRRIVDDCAARSALAFGPCLVGPIAGSVRPTLTAIGPATATVALLHARAAGGTILCDESAWSALKKHPGSCGPAIHQVVTPVLEDDRAPGKSPDHAVNERGICRQQVFRQDGEFWTLAYEGNISRLRDSKGLLYLSRLLGQPYTEVHCEQLAGVRLPGRSESLWRALGLRVGNLGDAGAVLDEKAKSAYRRRLDLLQEQLQEARDLGLCAHRMQIEEEMDALTRQLAAAVGLRGRDRRALATSERARINVTRAIRAALERIAHCDIGLGRHLRGTIRTGTFCSYNPHPGIRPPEWQIHP
jgi:class 3 adenylate cyclase